MLLREKASLKQLHLSNWLTTLKPIHSISCRVFAVTDRQVDGSICDKVRVRVPQISEIYNKLRLKCKHTNTGKLTFVG